MIIDEPVLFLRYAVPCGHVLVKRRDLPKERLEYLEKCAIEENEPEGNLEDDFKISVRMLMLTAKRMGKPSIDIEVIRKYFWKEHKACVEWRAKMFPDIDTERCVIRVGEVIGVNGEEATIELKESRAVVNTKFEPDIKEGDWVIIHYDYIVEKITPEQAVKVE